MKKIIVLLILILPRLVLADDFSKAHGDFFKLYLRDNADINVRYLIEKGMEDKNTSAKYDLDYYTVNGEIPSALSRDSFMRWGFDYGLRSYDLHKTKDFIGGADTLDLHRIKFSPGVGTFVNDNLLLTGNVDIGMFTNFKGDFDLDLLKYYAYGKVAWRMHPGSLIYLGLEKTDNFDDVTFYPTLGIKLLTEGGEFRISLDLPKELKLDYNIGPKSQIYFLISVQGEKYRITEGDPEKEFNVFIQDKRIGLGATHWFTNHIAFNFEAGMAVSGDFAFETLDTVGYFGEMDSTGYLTAAFKFAL